VQFQYNFSMSLSTTGHIRGLKGFITLGSRKDVQMIRRCTVQRLPSRAPRWLSSCSKVSMNHPTLHLLVLVLSSVTCLPPIGLPVGLNNLRKKVSPVDAAAVNSAPKMLLPAPKWLSSCSKQNMEQAMLHRLLLVYLQMFPPPTGPRLGLNNLRQRASLADVAMASIALTRP